MANYSDVKILKAKIERLESENADLKEIIENLEKRLQQAEEDFDESAACAYYDRHREAVKLEAKIQNLEEENLQKEWKIREEKSSRRR